MTLQLDTGYVPRYASESENTYAETVVRVENAREIGGLYGVVDFSDRGIGVDYFRSDLIDERTASRDISDSPDVSLNFNELEE